MRPAGEPSAQRGLSSRWAVLTDRTFVRHFLEMVVAMGVGMVVLGPLWPDLGDRPEVHVLGMATDMTVGMASWMFYRRHGWAPVAEMSAAMYVPFVVLFPPLWAGLLTSDAVMALGHLLMLPAMVVAMLRRPAEYTHRASRSHRG